MRASTACSATIDQHRANLPRYTLRKKIFLAEGRAPTDPTVYMGVLYMYRATNTVGSLLTFAASVLEIRNGLSDPHNFPIYVSYENSTSSQTATFLQDDSSCENKKLVPSNLLQFPGQSPPIDSNGRVAAAQPDPSRLFYSYCR